MLKTILLIILLTICNSSFAKTIEFKSQNIILNVPNKCEYFTRDFVPVNVCNELNITKSQAINRLISSNALFCCYDLDSMSEIILIYSETKETKGVGDFLNMPTNGIEKFKKELAKRFEKEFQCIVERTDVVDTANARYFRLEGFTNDNGIITNNVRYITIKNGAAVGFNGFVTNGNTAEIDKLLRYFVNNVRFSDDINMSSKSYNKSTITTKKPSTLDRAITKGISSAIAWAIVFGFISLGSYIWNKLKGRK